MSQNIAHETCSVCGALTETQEHRFFEGRHERPLRAWSYVAALYHHPVTHAPYCSPSCATKGIGCDNSPQ